MPTPRQAIEPLLRAGRLPEARAQLESLLAAGGAAEDFALLGLLCGMLNDPQASERACRRAIELKPEFPEAYANLGIALSGQGKTEEALSAYEQALALNPANPVTHNNRATALNALGRRSEAESGYRRAIELKADYPDAWYNLGNLLSTRGQGEEALECYRRTLAFNPRHVGALNNLAQSHLGRGESEPAIGLLEQALALAPNHAGTLNNLGNAWLAKDDLPRALDYLQKAAQLAPNDPAVLNNLGLAQLAAGNLSEARRCCEAVLRVQPESVEGWINFGNLREREDHHGEAERCYRAALARRPDSAEAHFNLGIALHGQGRLDEELASYDEALRLRPDYPDAWTNRLFALNFNPDWSPTAIFAEHRAWGEKFGVTRADPGLATRRALDGRKLRVGRSRHPAMSRDERVPRAQDAQERPSRDTSASLRVGYVSPDLREHSVAFFVEPVLRAHDRERFEIFCYAELPPGREDATSARLRALDLHWRDTRGLGDRELARRMREDGIDILVDLAGHTANNRLQAFAYRPAPVQVSWLGYPNTTGLPAIDYRLTDHWADPPGQESFHTEQLVRIPGGFLCFAPPESSPEVAPPPAARAGCITFGSFNMLPKVTPVVVAAWARILQAVPGSRLLLKNRSLRDPATQERYAGLFESHGIARERLEFVGWLPKREDHLALYGQVDIALDTFPYNGTTTTCEALWMGVPVIALEGNRHAARVGVSLLSRIALQELIAPDPDEYVRKAAELAGDPERLEALRGTMRKRLEGSGLCDAPAFAARLEAIYMNLMENGSESPDRPARS